MQIATAQEQEKVASYRHVDLTQWQRREVRLHFIKAIQVIRIRKWSATNGYPLSCHSNSVRFNWLLRFYLICFKLIVRERRGERVEIADWGNLKWNIPCNRIITKNIIIWLTLEINEKRCNYFEWDQHAAVTPQLQPAWLVHASSSCSSSDWAEECDQVFEHALIR